MHLFYSYTRMLYSFKFIGCIFAYKFLKIIKKKPATFIKTYDPPGWIFLNSVTSYTFPLTAIHVSSSLLCFEISISSKIKSFYLIFFYFYCSNYKSYSDNFPIINFFLIEFAYSVWLYYLKASVASTPVRFISISSKIKMLPPPGCSTKKFVKSWTYPSITNHKLYYVLCYSYSYNEIKFSFIWNYNW